MLAFAALLCALLTGCGGIGPTVPPEAEAAIVVVYANDAETDEPLAVEASAVAGGVRGAITLAEGSVVLRNVPFGTGTPPVQPVTVSAPGYVTQAEQVQISVTVATFFTAELTVADPAETGTVRGIVTGEGGTPITSALVRFTHEGPAGTVEVHGYTDNTGLYVIGGIPIGQNAVTAEAEGFVTTSANYTVVQDASAGQNPDLNPTLLPGSTRVDIRGDVFNAFDQQPLAGATVTVAGLSSVTTNAAGEFAINNVPVGEQTLTVTLTGYDEIEQQVNVLPGMGRLRIGMTPTAPQPPGGPHNLAGTVTLLGSADNSGAVVTAADTTTGQQVGQVTTPASGDYTMFLPPGEYRLTVTLGTHTVRRTVLVPGGGRVLREVNFVLTVG